MILSTYTHAYRLTHIIQQKVSKMKPGEANSETEWDELVREIWKENGLKHLRDAATPLENEESVIHDPGKGTVTHDFQEVTEEEFVFIDESDNDELDNQLPQNQPAQGEPTQSACISENISCLRERVSVLYLGMAKEILPY